MPISRSASNCESIATGRDASWSRTLSEMRQGSKPARAETPQAARFTRARRAGSPARALSLYEKTEKGGRGIPPIPAFTAPAFLYNTMRRLVVECGHVTGIEIYIGSLIEHGSDRAVLERVAELLSAKGDPAVILANVYLGRRQIDLVVALNH
jgi:hypothetical protein